ncbi:unnamed protein product [Durusdinium trenchii]|uniref:Malic enzyme n=1 Tax=Durusdinium trenchii TaxID=1381693 RepID=A0ABP0RIC6_9DINO
MVVQINLEGRSLSLPKTVVKRGAVDWNSQAAVKGVLQILDGACQAKTVDEALAEVRGFTSLGHMIWAYAYLRMLHHKDPNLFYRTVMAEPSFLMPIVYTPTVGEACQKFGQLPLLPRGCYVSLADRGNLKAVLKEYADLMLPKDSAGKPQCQCIVFSDGGRILGLGDLGVWGMGIPIGKLDLYTVCAGFNPHKTMPVMIDAGCTDANGNAAKLTIRDHILYHGMKENRVKHTSKAGTEVNSAYYGEDSFIGEFMTAARDLFGRNCLLQFEDFNSNDAFPLLEEYREKFLTYNDDIQGTASIIVAAALGGIKLQKPECTSLLKELQGMRVLFHGAGSANLGGAQLLKAEVQMAPGSVVVTNSKGVIWSSQDGSKGTFRNDEQKAVALIGEPKGYDPTDLVSIIKHHKPDILIGAVGKAPGCFTEEVVQAMLSVQAAKPKGGRPIIFALSNPMSQAEITAEDCYKFSRGQAIFGSGTRFPPVEVQGRTRSPGQVNNFFIFPGMSFAAVCCEATKITDHLFMEAAQAVANSLDKVDIESDSVLPNTARIRDVGHNVATAVVLAAQKANLAQKPLGETWEEVAGELASLRWDPAGQSPIIQDDSAAPACAVCSFV